MKSEKLLSAHQILLLYLSFFVVYVLGLFVPLMENDSAQHATMAMKMVLQNDFLNIYKGENPYLDKPHLHFWLSALSMKFFGINHIAYRIPAFLCIALGAFSTKKLAHLLYENSNLSFAASLIFLSAQTIILSAHDVRTDAVLTGFVIFALWQIIAFIKTNKIKYAVLGGLATAFAFSSKGLMGFVIIGFCVLAYLLYSREWKRIFNFKTLLFFVCFFVGLLPILYAYHRQFGVDGIKFILLGQSVDRMTGNGFAANNSDYFFFFHTLLWVFMPFSLLFYTGVFKKTVEFFKIKFKIIEGKEFLSLGGFWLVMLVFSASTFKLPHYLNGLIAVLSIFTAAFLFEESFKKKVKLIKVLYAIQVFVFCAGTVVVGLLAWYFTEVYNVYFFIISVVLFAFLFLYRVFAKENIFKKFLVNSLFFSIAINVFLNSQFYPKLTQFQGGLQLAEFVNENKIPKNRIFMLTNNETWSFDFYTQQNTDRVEVNELKKGDYLVIYDEQLQYLKKNFKVIATKNHYRITRLSLKFLNPETRTHQLKKIYLVQILN